MKIFVVNMIKELNFLVMRKFVVYMETSLHVVKMMVGSVYIY